MTLPIPSPVAADSLVVGMDIGGSHISAALVEAASGRVLEDSHAYFEVDANGSADAILDQWSRAAAICLDRAARRAAGIGIAMPGPFDYDLGVSRIQGLNKYESLYGMNVRTRLKERLRLAESFPVLFRNDAECFLLGESWGGAAREFDSVIGLTLGTGFGSAFLRGGRLAADDDSGLPPGKWLYPAPFRGATAEDYFSSRGVVRRYGAMGGGDAVGVREIAERAEGDLRARAVLVDFGEALAEFMSPWIRRFRPDCLVIGGNVARAWRWFAPGLEGALGREFPCLAVRLSLLFEKAALLGAARLPLTESEPPPNGSEPCVNSAEGNSAR